MLPAIACGCWASAEWLREEIADGDVALAALKFGDVIGDLIVEAKFALGEQLHDGGSGGDDFGEGGAVEDGVERHGLGLRD